MKPVTFLLAALSLAGCAATDPLTRDGLWQSSGANEANLAAMVVNPADLVQGRGAEGSDGQRAAAAIARLRTDHVKHLLDSGVAQFNTQPSPQAESGGGASAETP